MRSSHRSASSPYAPELVPEHELRAALSNVFGARIMPGIHATAWIDVIESPVGALIVGATSQAVCLIEFADRARLDTQLQSLCRRFPENVELGSNAWLSALRMQLTQYFSGARRSFDLPLAYPGTPFQEKVWSTLLTIPFGRTWSYRQLAEHIGDPSATRAVGLANGANPIAIVIPCHRVVNAGGELGGYGGGMWRKRVLLDLEKGQMQLAL